MTNFLDIWPDEIIDKIISSRIDNITKEILEVELKLLKYIQDTDNKFCYDYDCEEEYFNITYGNIIYSIDKPFFNNIIYKKVCVILRIEVYESKLIFLSKLIKNANNLDLLKATNNLFNEVNLFYKHLLDHNVDTEFEVIFFNNHTFLECFSEIKFNNFKNNIPVFGADIFKTNKRNIKFIEPFMGS